MAVEIFYFYDYIWPNECAERGCRSLRRLYLGDHFNIDTCFPSDQGSALAWWLRQTNVPYVGVDLGVACIWEISLI